MYEIIQKFNVHSYSYFTDLSLSRKGWGQQQPTNLLQLQPFLLTIKKLLPKLLMLKYIKTN